MENEKELKEIPEETAAAQEVSPVEQTESAEEASAAEAPAEEAAAGEKKATPGKLALVIGAIVVVIAVIVALVAGSGKTDSAAGETEARETVEETVPATVPADGNPDDETCKGTYTVTDEEVKAAADRVVATIGEHSLTNAQFQAFYWIQVQSFLSSDYGNMVMYYGMLDYTQPLDTQLCTIADGGTWQQFFVKEALNTWHNYTVLADMAAQNGMALTEENLTYLDSMKENLETTAAYYGLESLEELLEKNIGAGATYEDYHYFQKLLMEGNLYYDAEYAKLVPTQEELEAFFAEHEEAYAQSDITWNNFLYVDARHVLFTPQGGTTDENGSTTYSEEEWEACRLKAEEALENWKNTDGTEEGFAAMAEELTEDPGSKSTGGLYEDIYQGQMVAEFEDWCFDTSRKAGDYGIVKTTYGYHLMYFSDCTYAWSYYAQQDWITEQANSMMEELTAEYPMEVSYGDILLGYVNMAG